MFLAKILFKLWSLLFTVLRTCNSRTMLIAKILIKLWTCDSWSGSFADSCYTMYSCRKTTFTPLYCLERFRITCPRLFNFVLCPFFLTINFMNFCTIEYVGILFITVRLLSELLCRHAEFNYSLPMWFVFPSYEGPTCSTLFSVMLLIHLCTYLLARKTTNILESHTKHWFLEDSCNFLFFYYRAYAI